MTQTGSNRILLVEDDPTHAFIIRKFVGDTYQLDVANNGHSAIELVLKKEYALVLMDIDLGRGNLNGTEVLHKIRSKEEFKDLQVIATTAFDGENAKQQLLSEGFNLHLPKPITKDALMASISRLIDN